MTHSNFRGTAARVLMLLPLVICSCRLIDQTTFDPALKARLYAPKKKTPPPARPTGQPPLLSIHFDETQGGVDYQDSLRLAVAQALQRKPDVKFDVVTIIPESDGVDADLSVAERNSSDARRVAAEIQSYGVDEGQVALGVRPEAGLTGHDVRVYVH